MVNYLAGGFTGKHFFFLLNIFFFLTILFFLFSLVPIFVGTIQFHYTIEEYFSVQFLNMVECKDFLNYCFLCMNFNSRAS